MAKLKLKQKERISEMQGNIAVAWYAAGVISPYLLQLVVKNACKIVYN